MGSADPTRGAGAPGPSTRRNLLSALERDGLPVGTLATRLGWSERKVPRRIPRRPARTDRRPAAPSERVGLGCRRLPPFQSSLLAERDTLGRELVEEGVDALELMELDETGQAAAYAAHARTGQHRPGDFERPATRAPRVARVHRPFEAATAQRRPWSTRAQPASRGASMPPQFVALAHDLRNEIIEHYERHGERLDTPAGLLTLDTNSVLAATRGRLLLRLLAERAWDLIAGLRVLDLGAGFGALALYFAHLGAAVVAVDPNEQRTQVALTIATRRGLRSERRRRVRPIAALRRSLLRSGGRQQFALLHRRSKRVRRAALSETHRVLRPDGWLIDAQSKPPAPARPVHRAAAAGDSCRRRSTQRVAHALGRHRSQVRYIPPVRQHDSCAAQASPTRTGAPIPVRRLRDRFASYHHVLASARRPSLEPAAGWRQDPHSWQAGLNRRERQ